jgi:indolepyruvate ferredoxin oxidoreductase beta subunit
MSIPRPITLLIAALGGEGGGVLTNWIVEAAEQTGFPVQSTSIPGVAQRTGATTYYIEIMPATAAELGGRLPILALNPGVGDIDIAVASELLEAGRTIANGFVTPDRTFAIASVSRFFAMDEKIAIGDGRVDPQRLREAIEANAREALLIDMAELARKSGSIVSAVMLGAIAGCGRLPIQPETFEAAIRKDGKAVDANLRGFRAGLEAARAKTAPAPVTVAKRHTKIGALADVQTLEQEAAQRFPAAAMPIVAEGLRRLTKYQDARYARLYLDRLAPINDLDARGNAGGKLVAETARHLAVRMSYEDVIRVAEAKIAPERMQRIAQQELRATNGEPFTVHDFLKPGFEELCQVLPPFLARPILSLATRKGWLGRVYFGMEINSTSVSGYLRFLMLAKLKRLRRRGYRFAQEQAQIENWLALIADAARLSPALALEVAECARLIKGYGDTHARGTGNFHTIEMNVIRPALAGRIPAPRAIDAIASARTAALLDPEGEGLAKCIAAIGGQPDFRVAAE